MKKDISFEHFVDRGKAMIYMMALSAVAFVLFVVVTSLKF